MTLSHSDVNLHILNKYIYQDILKRQTNKMKTTYNRTILKPYKLVNFLAFASNNLEPKRSNKELKEYVVYCYLNRESFLHQRNNLERTTSIINS